MELGFLVRILSMWLLVFLLGCANTKLHTDILKNQGVVRYEEINKNLYKVFIKNTVDFGWSGDSSTDRMSTIKNLLKNDCVTVNLIEENFIQTGSYALNRPAGTWIMKVSCEN